MIKHSPNPPFDSTSLQGAAQRAIDYYLNPPAETKRPAEDHRLFTVREGLDAEVLLINASEDLASLQVLATHLAFEVDGTARRVALGICRMLEGVELLVNNAVVQYGTEQERGRPTHHPD
ncbi:hypothetical protein HBO12_21010 [Pseudomonas sp. WS 5059]|uniref:DUF6124 family protein n=1 Tax=Pseudomonas sp. WS 5059 TaxID=2717491 RepID=UPI001474F581|nr:hypothetical protein [Pseudomonas sp. WS 5059]NMY05447.1 hypothetical protein [Pseudomonas sp. WS 5059]